MYGLTTQCFEKDLEDLFGFGLRDIVASNASKKLNKLAGYKPLPSACYSRKTVNRRGRACRLILAAVCRRYSLARAGGLAQGGMPALGIGGRMLPAGWPGAWWRAHRRFTSFQRQRDFVVRASKTSPQLAHRASYLTISI
jgi:hypothetical protein